MPTANPTPIRDQYYANLKKKKDFIAYRPWGGNPNHTNINNNFIPIAGFFAKRFDYNGELKKLIESGWKRSAKPNGAAPQLSSNGTPSGPVIGRGRSNLPNPQSPFKGFTRSQLVSDWDHMTLFEQVAAYTFRGDSRSAEQLESCDGFHPPFARTDDSYKKLIAHKFAEYIERKEGKTSEIDSLILEKNVYDYLNNLPGITAKRLTQYELFRTVMESSRMHLRGMTNDSFMKSYVSTTRDIAIAMTGSDGNLGGVGSAAAKLNGVDRGWVYVLRVESGFMLKTGVGGVTKKEAEVAHLGSIAWNDVYGFRHVTMMPGQDSNIYIRRGFFMQDDVAFKQVLGALTFLLPDD